MIATLILSGVFFAPPPVPAAKEGRITVWVGDKFEHFCPDGSDVVPIAIPKGVKFDGPCALTPNQKYVVHRDVTGTTRTVAKTKLIITPLFGEGKQYTLDGYVVGQLNITPDGSKAIFTGAKGDELEIEKMLSAGGFSLDLATKKVEPINLPTKHSLFSVAPDGKTFLTVSIESDNNTYSRRTYIVLPDGKPVEVLKETVFTLKASFSPDGTKVLIHAKEYTDVQSNGNGGYRATGSKPSELLILDLQTKKILPVCDLPMEGILNGLVWSPDGTRVAYLWHDPRNTRSAAALPVPAGAPGGIVRPEHEYTVFVADVDGADRKVVYKSKTEVPGFRAFMWK